MKYFWRDWKNILRDWEKSSCRILFLDFDGTLTPIVNDPKKAHVNEGMAQALNRLASKKSNQTVIVSGRSLKDLRSRFSNRHVLFMGNHGLEMTPHMEGMPFPAKLARKHVPFLRILERKLRITFMFWPGVWVEDKKYSLSLHYRNLSKDQFTMFHELILFFQHKFKDGPLVWRHGKRVWEIRPRVDWDKGRAVQFVHKKLKSDFCLILGDDTTDEDMFSRMRDKAYTIRVGRSKRSSADYYLKNTQDVRALLETLSRLPSKHRSMSGHELKESVLCRN